MALKVVVFPRAVRAEQGDDFALANVDYAVQRLDVAVVNVQVFDFKQHVASIRHGCVS